VVEAKLWLEEYEQVLPPQAIEMAKLAIWEARLKQSSLRKAVRTESSQRAQAISDFRNLFKKR